MRKRETTSLHLSRFVLLSLASALSSRLWPLPSAYAAPCCGALSATPSMITGDDAAQVSVSFAQSSVIGDAPASGLPVFRADGDTELSRTLRVESALLLSDHWQIGAGIPLTQRSRDTSRTSSSASGLGDLSVSGAYEILPEWEYSSWKPHGFAFSQLIVPTGGSVHDSATDFQSPWALDARGRGFFSLGAGVVLIKAFSSWDTTLLGEAHHAFLGSFSAGPLGDLRLTPGWGASLALGGGYSLAALPLRFGGSLAPAYEAGIRAEGAFASTSEPQLVWNASAQLGWSVTRSASLNAIYTDQTLFGPATNVALNRTLALTFQKRWER